MGGGELSLDDLPFDLLLWPCDCDRDLDCDPDLCLGSDLDLEDPLSSGEEMGDTDLSLVEGLT